MLIIKQVKIIHLIFYLSNNEFESIRKENLYFKVIYLNIYLYIHLFIM